MESFAQKPQFTSKTTRKPVWTPQKAALLTAASKLPSEQLPIITPPLKSPPPINYHPFRITTQNPQIQKPLAHPTIQPPQVLTLITI